MADQQVPSGTDLSTMVIGIFGGTGDQGRGLAARFAAAGNPVIIGSRSAERAAAAAGSCAEAASAFGMVAPVRGLTNAEAARAADVVIVAVPWDGHRALLASLAAPLAGKIVIDCVNPMGFDERGRQRREQSAVALPGNRDDHHVRFLRRLRVRHAADRDTRPEQGCRFRAGGRRDGGTLRTARSDDDRVARRGEPGGQTASLVTGAAKDPDNQGCDVDPGWLLLVRHALDPARAGERRDSMGV